MPLDRPVFMLGTGRSGTTLVFSLVARHPSLAWFSNYDLKFGQQTGDLVRGAVLFTKATASLNWRTERRGVLRPAEAYALWGEVFPGFAQPYRSLAERDLTPWMRRRITRFLEDKVERTRAADRLLLKWTGWSRVGFMSALFPDARFVHVHRHGGAVANSLMQQPWWKGWEGPAKWRWGPLPAELDAEWKSHDESFVALAGLQWRLQYREIEAALDTLPTSRVLRVPYEDVCADPVGEVRRILAFAELDEPADLADDLADTVRGDAVERWRERDLTPEQVATLDAVVGPDMAFRATRMR